jgi:type I restriction enzyme S subunit
MSRLHDTWATSTLGEVLNLRYGKALPERSRTGKNYPVFGSNGIVGYHQIPLTSGETVIVGRKGSIGEVHFSQGSCWPIDTTYFVDEFHGMPARYWLYQLQNLGLRSLNRATAIPGLNREDVYLECIAVPPINEQKRIADKLDSVLGRVDACLERLDRVPAIFKRFRQAVLAAATSGKLTEEWRVDIMPVQKWRTTKVGSLLTDIRYGTAKKCRYDPKKTPVLRIPNVIDGRINLDDMKHAEFEQGELRKFALAAGDILLIRSNGSVGLVGRTALVSEREQGFLFAGYLIRLRVNQAIARPAYISLHLMSPKSRVAIERVARSTSGVNNINTDEIKGLTIELPGVEEQDEVVRRVESLFSYADQLEARYTAARDQVERLTPSLLAKAFRGELVHQDANDEPASVLLERIRAAREATPAKSKRTKLERGVKMSKATAQSVKDIIRELPDDRFTFSDLSSRASTDYETLKDILFVLLAETQPLLKQVFNTKTQSMQFVRVKQ